MTGPRLVPPPEQGPIDGVMREMVERAIMLRPRPLGALLIVDQGPDQEIVFETQPAMPSLTLGMLTRAIERYMADQKGEE